MSIALNGQRTASKPLNRIMFEDAEFCAAWDQMAQRVHALSREQGFWDGERHPSHPIAHAMSELGESFEAWRMGNPPDKNISHRSAVEVQLGDVLGLLLDMSAGYDLDLAGALIDKMEFNKGRGRLHGKRY